MRAKPDWAFWTGFDIVVCTKVKRKAMGKTASGMAEKVTPKGREKVPGWESGWVLAQESEWAGGR